MPSKIQRALRRRNGEDTPPWLWPTVIGFAALTTGAAIYETVRRANAPVYHYWAEEIRQGDGFTSTTRWLPHIQKQGDPSVLVLDDTLTKQMALWNARDEIVRLGGNPQASKPV